MLKFYDNLALSQSNAMISVAYNSYYNLLLITSFMKQDPGLTILLIQQVGLHIW